MFNNQENLRLRDDRKIFKLVQELDTRGKCAIGEVGVKEAQLAQPGAQKSITRSSQLTAEKVGTSARMVERVRTILDKGDKSLSAEVLSGNITINAAYNKIKAEKGQKRTIADIFMQFISSTVSEERWNRVLGAEELSLIKRMAEQFETEGYLDTSELKRIEEIISRKTFH